MGGARQLADLSPSNKYIAMSMPGGYSEPYLGFFVGGGGGVRGKLRTPLTGVSRIQTGFLIGRFVFTPTRKAASKTFKTHTDAFCLKCHDFLWHKHLV